MSFCHTYSLESIVKHCYKNSKNPSCINLIPNDKQERPLKVKTIKPGLSEFEKPIVSVFKTNFQK